WAAARAALRAGRAGNRRTTSPPDRAAARGGPAPSRSPRRRAGHPPRTGIAASGRAPWHPRAGIPAHPRSSGRPAAPAPSPARGREGPAREPGARPGRSRDLGLAAVSAPFDVEVALVVHSLVGVGAEVIA